MFISRWRSLLCVGFCLFFINHKHLILTVLEAVNPGSGCQQPSSGLQITDFSLLTHSKKGEVSLLGLLHKDAYAGEGSTFMT